MSILPDPTSSVPRPGTCLPGCVAEHHLDAPECVVDFAAPVVDPGTDQEPVLLLTAVRGVDGREYVELDHGGRAVRVELDNLIDAVAAVVAVMRGAR